MKKVLISIIGLLSVIMFTACKAPSFERLTEAQKYYNQNFGDKKFIMPELDENGDPIITDAILDSYYNNHSNCMIFDQFWPDDAEHSTIGLKIEGFYYNFQLSEIEFSDGKLKISLVKTSEVFESGDYCYGGTVYLDGSAYLEILSNNEEYMLIKVSCSWYYECNNPIESKQYAGLYVYAYPKQYTPEDNNNNDSDDNNENNDGEDNISMYNGTYSFTKALPPQMNGSITLIGGNWTYSGDKTSPAASCGTYSVSNNKLTMKWNASGVVFSETFVITNDGPKSTWKSENTGTSTFFTMLFGVLSLNMEFTKS